MSPRAWRRYVAIGDSFTEGMCDPQPEPETGYVGWADRLAGHLAARAAESGAQLRYANLAVRGRKLDDVVGPQLDAALALEPDLVSIVGGGNDILRTSVDLAAIARQLEDAVARVRATGAGVLLATPTDPGTSGIFAALRPRHAIHTANLHSIAARQRCAVIDIWGLHALHDRRMWAEDRIHLTSEGHRRVALAALAALGLDTDRDDWATPLPPAQPRGRRTALSENLSWGRAHAAPWVQRRLHGRSSGEGRPAKRPELEPIEPLTPAH